MLNRDLVRAARYYARTATARAPATAFAAGTEEPPERSAFVTDAAGSNVCVLLDAADPDLSDRCQARTLLLQVAALLSSAMLAKSGPSTGGIHDGALWRQALEHVPLWSPSFVGSLKTDVPATTDALRDLTEDFATSVAGPLDAAVRDQFWSLLRRDLPAQISPAAEPATVNLLILALRDHVGSAAASIGLQSIGIRGVVSASSSAGAWNVFGSPAAVQSQVKSLVATVAPLRPASGINLIEIAAASASNEDIDNVS